MSHKCFISFKTEDKKYKKYIQEDLKIDMIDKSLNTPINSTDEDYIMRKIREGSFARAMAQTCGTLLQRICTGRKRS